MTATTTTEVPTVSLPIAFVGMLLDVLDDAQQAYGDLLEALPDAGVEVEADVLHDALCALDGYRAAALNAG